MRIAANAATAGKGEQWYSRSPQGPRPQAIGARHGERTRARHGQDARHDLYEFHCIQALSQSNH